PPWRTTLRCWPGNPSVCSPRSRLASTPWPASASPRSRHDGGLPRSGVSMEAGRPGSERAPPAETRELGVVAVVGDPLTAGLDGHGGEPGVLRQVADSRDATAQLLEDGPVTRSRLDHGARRLAQHGSSEGECVVEPARPDEDTRMRGHANHRAQDLW